MNIENEVEELKRKVRDLEDEIKKVRHTAEEPLDVTRLAARLSDAVVTGGARLVASEVRR